MELNQREEKLSAAESKIQTIIKDLDKQEKEVKTRKKLQD